MSQPVKLSDRLVLDARLTGEASVRSIAGQIEFWANLGRAVEPLIEGRRVLALSRAGRAKPLSDCLREADTAVGRRRLREHLDRLPFPRYEPAEDRPGFLVRIEKDGTRTVGRFVSRRFQPVRSARR